ncbi:SIR2 family protein [Plesiomonas shigelloides]|uniref:SIR2 family protein n=1 Tax=Plesiomonas shigelloides TaxID=703 RepID=UPI0030BDD565
MTIAKRKLIVVVGAGASIELGMPSVNDIDTLFSSWSREHFLLDNNKTLYCHIKEVATNYYNSYPIENLRKITNFEELLYILYFLSSSLTDHRYENPINGFHDIRMYQDLKFKAENNVVSGHHFRKLSLHLIDQLLVEFKTRCTASMKDENFHVFSKFINSLHNDFDVAFITLNYDNLITQACPTLFTGFNHETGKFEPHSIYDREQWGMIYHLHGSIHFDMSDDANNLHEIKWTNNIDSCYFKNSINRNSQVTNEGINLPTSTIIAGYGKTSQIQRLPFRTYYSQLDSLMNKADAFLFLGYGFNDPHLNNSFYSIRHGANPRPVVVIDWANYGQFPLRYREDDWSTRLHRAIPFEKIDMYANQNIDRLKDKSEFEVSTNPDRPLSVWYNGFISACRAYDKVKLQLMPK